MALPALVLVHGGQHAGDCWDPTVDEIHRQAPELAVHALDLPGRRGKPGDLTTATIDDWVESLVSDIDAAGVGERCRSNRSASRSPRWAACRPSFR